LYSISASQRKWRGGGLTIIRRRGLLDEPWLELCELLHVLDGFRDAPDLVRIDHEDVALVEADDFARDAEALLVLREVASDLEFEVAVALRQRLLE
jgi:hypothetical protein